MLFAADVWIEKQTRKVSTAHSNEAKSKLDVGCSSQQRKRLKTAAGGANKLNLKLDEGNKTEKLKPCSSAAIHQHTTADSFFQGTVFSDDMQSTYCKRLVLSAVIILYLKSFSQAV